jgi:uncharacterized protein (DUF4415 family)
MATAPKKPAAKKAAKKPVAAKKPAAKKPAAKKAAPKLDTKPVVAKKQLDTAKTTTPKAKPAEAQVLYTFRLAPSLVEKLKARGLKDGLGERGHAQVARTAIEAYFAKATT